MLLNSALGPKEDEGFILSYRSSSSTYSPAYIGISSTGDIDFYSAITSNTRDFDSKHGIVRNNSNSFYSTEVLKTYLKEIRIYSSLNLLRFTYKSTGKVYDNRDIIEALDH